jgi:germination protein YpeB
MEETYYEIENNVMTVNYAYSDLGKRVYPDLVKVSVAMDNGEILGYDAKGFLVNHTEREYPEKLYSQTSAEKSISPKLTVLSHRLAVIPTDGLNEKLCYEFVCQSESGRKTLVYINAETGEEEQILLLVESESGVLTE